MNLKAVIMLFLNSEDVIPRHSITRQQPLLFLGKLQPAWKGISSTDLLV